MSESKYGHSRADFIAKSEIALKETSETGKWLELLYKTNYIGEVKIHK
ncbi:MAG: four helix bundle protein [Ruminococcaceae bacterium]|nr:four helix bundle protein [Oscillospiraceae bacterium]